MTPEDIHTRLVAEVNERLERAKAATPGPWVVDDEQHAEAIYAPDNTVVVAGARWGGEASAFETTEDALHIAANDPATVIRHCEADLRRLERHAPDRHYDGTFVCSANCSVWSEAAEEWLPAPHPCAEVRDVAYAYGVSLNDGNEEGNRG